MKYSEWDSLLQDDPDRSFLLQGLREGFRVVDSDIVPHPAEVDNYKSALDNSKLVEDQINIEVGEGRYAIVSEKPAIVSALGAIKKPDGRIRLIHDCSRPFSSVKPVFDLWPHIGSCKRLADIVNQDVPVFCRRKLWIAKLV